MIYWMLSSWAASDSFKLSVPDLEAYFSIYFVRLSLLSLIANYFFLTVCSLVMVGSGQSISPSFFYSFLK